MKKRNNYLYLAAALLLVMLAAGCTADDDFSPAPDNPAASSAPLTITVTDGAYAPAPSADDDATPAPATRAVERGYATEFTAGDKIGLYEVKQEAVSGGFSYYYKVTTKNSNLCLTYDGTAWTLPPGAELSPERPSANERTYYYAYYPWQDDSYMNGIVDYGRNWNSAAGIPPTPQEVFSNLILFWNPANDQSTYADYTASDLMVAKGELRNRTDGDGHALHFTMEHQMSLIIVRLPGTKYTYSETIKNVAREKSYNLYFGHQTNILCWEENYNTMRCLRNSRSASPFFMNGSYYNSNLEKRNFSITELPDPGTYKLYTIDGGAETVTKRPLQAGDFYMNDGGIIPKNNVTGTNMPDGVRKDCLGVVFWVGEIGGKHWTQTGYKAGDHLLMHDHPECVHGIVVALKNAASDKREWSSSTNTSDTYTWFKSYEATGQKAERELMVGSTDAFGYNFSRRIQWYRDYGEQRTEAYDAIEAFARTNPTPTGCSGWYFPTDYEMIVMSRGTSNLDEDYGMDTLLDAQFDKVGGSKFTNDYYWSSTDAPGSGHCIRFSDNYRIRDNKKNKHYVRAVLVF